MRGGADLHFRDIIVAAVAQGMEVTLVVGRVDADTTAPAGVRVVVARGLGRMVADGRRLAALDALLAWADVIHAQNIMNPTALARITETGRAVVTVQDHRVFCPGPGKTLPCGTQCTTSMDHADCSPCLPDTPYRQATKALTAARRDALRGAKRVVLSQYMADELTAVGLPDAKVIPPWVIRVDDSTQPRTGFMLGGRLVTHKACETAWRAWRDANTALPLWVAGDGPLLAQLDGALALGWLSRSALRRQLCQTRALLFPSRWQEPFGILGVEALSCGAPVIAIARGGMKEWAVEGCVLVERPSELQTAIAALANDPHRAAVLGRAGQARVRAMFSQERLAGHLWQLYDETQQTAPRR